MSSMTAISRPQSNQQGIVSIVIVLVFIAVTLLIVTGFAQVAQRNSRIALDSQLSQQALYAAESGVNDAVERIRTVNTVTDQTACTGAYTVNGGAISEGVSYTCQLVSLTPSTLSYDSVTDRSIVIPVETTSGNIPTLAVTWQKQASAPASATGSGCTTGVGTWPAATGWPAGCHYGVMRLDILPATAITTPEAAAQATATAFVYPGSGATATLAYTGMGNRYSGGTAAQGRILQTSCNTSVCTLNILGLNFPKAYLRVSFLYRTTQRVEIGAATESTNGFRNTQAVVDVTGKAQDVLRRIQVRVSLSGTQAEDTANGFPEYAIQSNESICKKYYAVPAPATAPTQPVCN